MNDVEKPPIGHIDDCPQKADPQAECKCEVDGVYCRCIICRMTFTKDAAWGRETCPECGTKFKPLHPTGKRQVSIHWHELQTLGYWAEQFAAMYAEASPDMKRAVYAITHELEVQHPLDAPLTLARELGMRDHASWVGNIEPIGPKIRLQ